MFPDQTARTQHPRYGRNTGPVCSECGATLESSWEKRLGVCKKLQCRGPHYQRRDRERRERARQERDEVARQARSVLESEAGNKAPCADDALLIVIPHAENRLQTPPQERVQRLRHRIEAEMAEAVTMLAEADDIATIKNGYDRPDNGPDAFGILNACATCQGACCRKGGNHAFIDKWLLAWRLASDETLAADAVVDDYMSRIPERTIEDACLFLTETGCALPREIRSSVCNGYLCPGIEDRMDRMHDDPEAPTIAVSHSDGRFHRVGVSDRTGQRMETRLNVGRAPQSGGPDNDGNVASSVTRNVRE